MNAACQSITRRSTALVQRYAPELEKKSRPHLRPTNDSYRVDETYVKIKGTWYYLYRAVDSTGQTIDFMLSAKRDTKAAKRFFRKMLKLPQLVQLILPIPSRWCRAILRYFALVTVRVFKLGSALISASV